MPDCPFLTACGFFNDRMPGVEEVTGNAKAKYCHGDFARCARNQVCNALGRDGVPEDLYPMQQSRVRSVITLGQERVVEDN